MQFPLEFPQVTSISLVTDTLVQRVLVIVKLQIFYMSQKTEETQTQEQESQTQKQQLNQQSQQHQQSQDLLLKLVLGLI